MKILLATVIFCMAQTFIFSQKSNSSKRLDSLFTALAAQNQFSGSVLIAEKGAVIYKAGKGFSNEITKEKNSPATMFELASCSKQFIGVGIVLLHREHKIDYSDDITKYLPELKSFEGVKITDLLRHTSGIPEYIFGNFSEERANDRIATNDDLVRYYAAKMDTLEFQPGSKHNYTNTNYALLASVIERASNRKIEDYLKEKIFKPLRMNRTMVYNRRYAPKKLKNYAYGYSWIANSFEKAPLDDQRIGNMIVYHMDGIVGNAKISSTVEDIYKWINALKSNQLLTKEEFAEVMEVTKTEDGRDVNYGFGFEVRTHGDKVNFGHTGSWDGYITLIHQDATRDRTIIILNNFSNGVCPYETITEIMDNKAPSGEFAKKIDLPEDKVKQFTGDYVVPSEDNNNETGEKHIISYLDDHLVYNTNEGQWDLRFFPSGETTFQAIMQGGANGVMEFTRQEDGTMLMEMFQYGQKIGSAVRK